MSAEVPAHVSRAPASAPAALRHPADITIKILEWNDEELYAQTMALKQGNPNLKVLIAIGGW